ncbi:MAG: hypothetical protein ACRYF7_08135 [Janthinobacterium lividum]
MRTAPFRKAKRKLAEERLRQATMDLGDVNNRKTCFLATLAREGGFDAHLTKPAGLEEIDALLGRLAS